MDGVQRSDANPWGNFVGTWDLPNKLPGQDGLHRLFSDLKIDKKKHLDACKQGIRTETGSKQVFFGRRGKGKIGTQFSGKLSGIQAGGSRGGSKMEVASEQPSDAHFGEQPSDYECSGSKQPSDVQFRSSEQPLNYVCLANKPSDAEFGGSKQPSEQASYIKYNDSEESSGILYSGTEQGSDVRLSRRGQPDVVPGISIKEDPGAQYPRPAHLSESQEGQFDDTNPFDISDKVNKIRKVAFGEKAAVKNVCKSDSHEMRMERLRFKEKGVH